MAKKTYKNIHTIFEKAKRGHLGVEDTPRTRLFPKFNYNEKAELVKPYLHYIDERALGRSVDAFIRQEKSHDSLIALAKRFNKDLPNSDGLASQMQRIYDKFPKSMINDIFNMYYTQMQDLDFKDRSKSNTFRYQMLEKASNPVIKVLTKESNIKSMVFTRGLVQYFLLMMAHMQQQDPEAFKKMMDQMNNQSGEGDGEGSGQGKGKSKPGQDPNTKPGTEQDSPEGQQNGQTNGQSGSGDTKGKSLEQQLKEMAEKFDQSSAGKKIMDKVVENAKKTVEQVDSLMSEEEQKALWQDLSSGSNIQAAVNKTDANWLNKMEVELKKISMSMGAVKNKIKNMLDKSVSYFSAKEVPTYDNIFETDNMGGLEDYPLLHPQIRKILLEDINVKDIKRLGKIDIYIDVSGSMDSGCGIDDEKGHAISKVTFAKAFALKMKEMNLLNKIYKFESNVRYMGTTKLDILTVGGGGGTDLNKVIMNIKIEGRNAIVLTDAEDHCSSYTHHAYFIGVMGARFNSFYLPVLKQYHQGKQLIIFDGHRTYNVNEQGHPC